MSAMSVSVENCVNWLSAIGKPSRQSQSTILAMSKLMPLDEVVTVSTYTQLTNEKMFEQSKSRIEMSTPGHGDLGWHSYVAVGRHHHSQRALDTTARVF